MGDAGMFVSESGGDRLYWCNDVDPDGAFQALPLRLSTAQPPERA
jgi:hypothetical protein